MSLWFNIALRPRFLLGRTAQDGHLDSHTAPELTSGVSHGQFCYRRRRGRGAGYSDKSVTNIACGRHVPSAAEHYRQYFARGLPAPDTVSPVPEVSWLVSKE